MSGPNETVRVFDKRACLLGEGPLWHPARKQLFWFDILKKRLLSRDETGPLAWQFDEYVSAAGWVDQDRLLIASETRLFVFDLEDGSQDTLIGLEADNPVTRSNDGRADPWGGFWIGTMGKSAEEEAGSIYRFYQGKLERIIPKLTITNSICFSPDRTCAYYSDTTAQQIMRQPLDADGWPEGPAEIFVDLRHDGLNPDGAVVDSKGHLWNAQWGASRVARYSPDGTLDRVIALPALQASCPAFGGEDGKTLFVTTALEHLETPSPSDGQVFQVNLSIEGQREHQVVI